MDLSINGNCKVPPGFRFHPTEEELLQYYLKKKVAQEMIDLDVIPCVDLNKLEPWDIEERCRIGSRPQNEWYFFSRKDKKYPSGTRTNRATDVGFWKATGRDKIIYHNSIQIGLRKTLVFYLGRAPAGKKSDWIMYEYRLEDSADDANTVYNFGELKGEEWWVICRLFKKRNFMAKEKPETSSTSSNISNDHTLTFVTDNMKLKKQETKNLNTIVGNNNTDDQPSISFSPNINNGHNFEVCGNIDDDMLAGFYHPNSSNGCIHQENESIEDLSFSHILHDMQMPYLFPSTPYQVSEAYSSDMDLWSLHDQIW